MRSVSCIGALVLLVAIPAAVAWTAAPASAAAAKPAVSPTEQLQRDIGAVLAIVADRSRDMTERRSAARKTIAGMFAFAETARRALGPHAEGMTADQRAQFTALLGGLLTDAFVARIGENSGRYVGRLRDRIAYLRQWIRGREAGVSIAVGPPGRQVPVEVAFLAEGAEWRVYDIAVQGVLLTMSYRAQVDHILRAGSYDDLLARVRDRRLAIEPPIPGPTTVPAASVTPEPRAPTKPPEAPARGAARPAPGRVEPESP